VSIWIYFQDIPDAQLKEWLFTQHHTLKKPIAKISAETGISRITITRYCKKLGVTTRTISEDNKRRYETMTDEQKKAQTISAHKALLDGPHKSDEEKREVRGAYNKREERLAKNREWKRTHRPHINAYKRANRDSERIYEHIRRARKSGNGGSYTLQELSLLLLAQDYLCYYCGKPFYHNTLKAVYHIEHKLPLSRGGSNDISNIAVACPRCNFDKGTKTADEFLREKQF
jgi:5-methylcytosine-specific restriction endonuclease McrA